MSYNIKLKTKKQDNSGVLFTVITAFFTLALLVNFVKLTREYVVKKNVLRENEKDLLKAQKEQSNLKLSIKKNQSQDYIEEQARKLTLSKANETVVIMASPEPQARKEPNKKPKIANYKLWLQLFIK
jgi:cell division protein FtsB